MFEFFVGYMVGTANSGGNSGSIKVSISNLITGVFFAYFMLGICGLIYINFGSLSCNLTTIDSWPTMYSNFLNFPCEHKTALNWFFTLSIVIPILFFIGFFFSQRHASKI